VKLIGYEGGGPQGAFDLDCGAAAITDATRLVNASTRGAGPIEDGARLAEEGHLTLLATPLEIPDEVAARALYVAVLSQACLFLVEQPWQVEGWCWKSENDGFLVLLFDGFDAFNRWGKALIRESLIPLMTACTSLDLLGRLSRIANTLDANRRRAPRGAASGSAVPHGRLHMAALRGHVRARARSAHGRRARARFDSVLVETTDRIARFAKSSDTTT